MAKINLNIELLNKAIEAGKLLAIEAEIEEAYGVVVIVNKNGYVSAAVDEYTAIRKDWTSKFEINDSSIIDGHQE